MTLEGDRQGRQPDDASDRELATRSLVRRALESCGRPVLVQAKPLLPIRARRAYYEAHIQIAAPYCSIVAGIPLMFLVGWWVGMRPAMLVWLVYTLIDLAVLAGSGPTLSSGALVAVSLLTKLGSASLGALAASWRA